MPYFGIPTMDAPPSYEDIFNQRIYPDPKATLENVRSQFMNGLVGNFEQQMIDLIKKETENMTPEQIAKYLINVKDYFFTKQKVPTTPAAKLEEKEANKSEEKKTTATDNKNLEELFKKYFTPRAGTTPINKLSIAIINDVAKQKKEYNLEIMKQNFNNGNFAGNQRRIEIEKLITKKNVIESLPPSSFGTSSGFVLMPNNSMNINMILGGGG